MYKFKENSTVCFVGASIVANGRMMSRIYDYYRNTCGIKLEMYNCGIPGDTAAGGIARLYDTILCYNPTDVVLSFGMNDIKYFLYDGREADDTCIIERRNAIDSNIINMKKLADEFKSRGIGIIFNTVTPYDEYTESERPCFKGAAAAIRELSERFRVLAQEYGGNIVDTYTEFERISKKLFKEGKTLTGEDRIHPLPSGQELMAQIFLKAQGFDVEVQEDLNLLENAVNKPFSEWEAKRIELEKKAKATEFVEWVNLRGVRDRELMLEIVNERIKTEENEWVVGVFRNYLKNRDEAEIFKKKLLDFTKSVYNA